jgi:hypothetical protein
MECQHKLKRVGTVEQSRIRFVTANYHQLQGLRLVPLGLFLALWAVLDLLGVFGHARFPAGLPAKLLTRVGAAYNLGLLLALVAPLYYRYRYGSVDPLDRRSRNRWITAAVIAFFVLGRVDRSLEWPVSLQLLLVSVSLFVTVWHDGRVRAHYLPPAILWLGASFLPTVNAPPSALEITLFGLGGLTLIACGIGDHLLLTRTLATPRTTDDAAHSAAV